MTKRYLEDFAVGQVFRSGRKRVDKDEIFAFAKEYDLQPFHLDEAPALIGALEPLNRGRFWPI